MKNDLWYIFRTLKLSLILNRKVNISDDMVVYINSELVGLESNKKFN